MNTTLQQTSAASWQRGLTVVLAWGLVACICPAIRANDDLLAKHGFKPTTESLAGFFQSLNPEGDVVTRTQSLLDKLGTEDFRTREDAMTALLRLPQISLDLVRTATKHNDPEVRWRSQLVLKEAGTQSRKLLRAALDAIPKKKIKGLTAGIMSCVTYYEDASLQRLAQEALLETATEPDAELLRKSSKHPQPYVRVLALRTLIHILAEKAVDDVRPFLDDTNDEVRLVAAYELSKRGENDVLKTLLNLLESEEVKTRSRSVQLLRKLTGKRFSFVAYGQKKDRQAPVKAWQEWLAENGASLKLDPNVSLAPARLGRTLVAYYSMNLVVEFDENHKQVWSTSLPQPWSCEGLPNGHRLIASYGSNSVVEFDAKGEEVWRAKTPSNPSHAQRLENGNTLIALYSQNKIIELTPDKKTVRTITVPGPANHVQRTSDGYTLVSCGNSGVYVYDEEGKQVRKITGGRPFSAHRLENGNVLIADTTKAVVQERDRDDTVVWSKSGFGNPLDAIRLDNGNTLIAHSTGVTEVDQDGKTVWSDTRGYAIRVCYY